MKKINRQQKKRVLELSGADNRILRYLFFIYTLFGYKKTNKYLNVYCSMYLQLQLKWQNETKTIKCLIAKPNVYHI